MWAGGTASSADGVTVEALEGSWAGTVEVVFEETETTNDPVEDGFPASDVYVIRLLGFETGETTVPFKVTVPVSTIDLPTPIDEYAFAIETYNEDTGQWERNDAMAQYDENTNSVTFWANHFSKKRVVYIGDDPNVDLQKYVYKSDNNKFYITYFAPVTFNKPSNHLPPANPEWSGSGTAGNPDVPDYIEDLGKALETAMTYHTTKIIKPDGYLLFNDPTHDVVSFPDHAISEAITFLYFVALMVISLIERAVRKQMAEESIENLAILPQKMKTADPTWDNLRYLFRSVHLSQIFVKDHMVK